MKQFLLKHRSIWRSLLFFVTLSLLLNCLSTLSVELGRDHNPLLNFSTTSFFYEPKNTIDVLTIGTSNTYSSVAPLEWWHSNGYTGYTWGEPSQRIFETYEYLKKIYKKQTPKVVFLEIGSLYRDDTDVQAVDSLLKSRIANVLPIVTYHRNLAPQKWCNLGAATHSVTKGYMLRTDTKGVGKVMDYMAPNGGKAPIHLLCVKELKRCISLCQRNGSKVVLLSIPDHSNWDMQKHNAVVQLAEKFGVHYLDLNLELKDSINWNTDTADGGIHLNYKGAMKVTSYLGNYLTEHFNLPDHRGGSVSHIWDRDWKSFASELHHLT